MVKILLDKKPEMINAKNDDGKTPLFVAALHLYGKFIKKEEHKIIKSITFTVLFRYLQNS